MWDIVLLRNVVGLFFYSTKQTKETLMKIVPESITVSADNANKLINLPYLEFYCSNSEYVIFTMQENDYQERMQDRLLALGVAHCYMPNKLSKSGSIITFSEDGYAVQKMFSPTSVMEVTSEVLISKCNHVQSKEQDDLGNKYSALALLTDQL